MLRRLFIVVALVLFVCPITSGLEAPAQNFTRQEDVIYGRKFGVALTLDVFQPKENGNGIGIVFVVSGGWFSGHDTEKLVGNAAPFVRRGYTVFTVVHGSQPKFTIPEILQDMNRAVRFIRFHAKEYGIDPDQIGITGGSAGGHLSLMQGTAGDKGNPEAKDPIDRMSSRIQAVACFFPPTDFLNYGKADENGIGKGVLGDLSAPFDFHDFDPKLKKFVPVTDEEKIKEIGRKISPIYHVSAESPPTLIIHGDKDLRVPLQQSETMVEKLKAAGVEAKLIIKPGEKHGWAGMGPDQALLIDWFDAHLKKRVEAK